MPMRVLRPVLRESLAICAPCSLATQWSMPVDFLSLFSALNRDGVRYVLVGGLAAVLHGVDRITADVDRAIDLAPACAADCIHALTAAGFRPMLPVDPALFSDATVRAAWRRDRGMQVFSFWDPTHTRPSVDLFVENPLPFDELWGASQIVALDGVDIRVADIDHLIRLKAIAGRPQDLSDIERLREIERGS